MCSSESCWLNVWVKMFVWKKTSSVTVLHPDIRCLLLLWNFTREWFQVCYLCIAQKEPSCTMSSDVWYYLETEPPGVEIGNHSDTGCIASVGMRSPASNILACWACGRVCANANSVCDELQVPCIAMCIAEILSAISVVILVVLVTLSHILWRRIPN